MAEVMKSNVADKSSSLSKQFNIIVSNGSEAQLQELVDNNTTLPIKNSMIIAIETDAEGYDVPKSASVWLTDALGNLIEIAKPISKIEELERRITAMGG